MKKLTGPGKVESEKVGLNLNIQKMKIMASITEMNRVPRGCGIGLYINTVFLLS